MNNDWASSPTDSSEGQTHGGTGSNRIFCQNCGQENGANFRFCMSCGAELGSLRAERELVSKSGQMQQGQKGSPAVLIMVISAGMALIMLGVVFVFLLLL